MLRNNAQNFFDSLFGFGNFREKKKKIHTNVENNKKFQYLLGKFSKNFNKFLGVRGTVVLPEPSYGPLEPTRVQPMNPRTFFCIRHCTYIRTYKLIEIGSVYEGSNCDWNFQHSLVIFSMLCNLRCHFAEYRTK